MYGCRPLSCCRFLIAAIMLTVAWCLLVLAADEPVAADDASTATAAEAAQGRPTIAAVYVDTPPVIDGQLDDPCWAKATRVEGFYCSQWDAPSAPTTKRSMWP